MAAKMTLEEVQAIVNQVNGIEVDGYAELNTVLSKVPGIKVVCCIDDVNGSTTLLNTLFEDAQFITLHVRFYPATGKEDYDIGFLLHGTRFIRIAYGWFSDIVYAKAHPA